MTVYSIPDSSQLPRSIGRGSIWPASPDSSSPAFPITSRERGARRERVFIGEDDDALYRDLLASQCRKHGVAAPIA